MPDIQIKISVILPCYNSEKYISTAINSFLAQDYSNKELIIVDAKSSDSSHEIIEEFCSQHQTIKWIKEEDKNVTDAINIGLKHCTGDFIAFLAADVYYYTTDLFSTINYNYNLIPFDGIYFDYYYYKPNHKEIILSKCPTPHFTTYNLLTLGTIAGFDNVFISKKIYERHQFNPAYNLCSDWELFLRITQESPLIMYVEKVATINVQDGNNLSARYYKEQSSQIEEVGKLYNKDNLRLYFEPQHKGSIKQQTKQLVKSIIKKAIGR